MVKKHVSKADLNIFQFHKQDKRWDSVPMRKVSVADLDDQAFAHFRKCAIASRRLPKDEVTVTNSTLLKQLRLMEERYLKRAAILFFHSSPEKFIPGAYIKIDYWGNGDARHYQDTIHGNLFEQVDKTINLILAKYKKKALISNEEANGVGTFSFPVRAFGEAVLNAVTHKDYSCESPVQISVYDDRISVWNEGQLPESWTVQQLFNIHPSIPYNPDVANTFFRAGYIDAWGTGIHKIRTECIKMWLPELEFDDVTNGLMVVFRGMPG